MKRVYKRFIIISKFLTFIITTMFQVDRVFFAVTIIVCYFRLLRFWFVLASIGPRIIAIEMMVIYQIIIRLLLAYVGIIIYFREPWATSGI